MDIQRFDRVAVEGDEGYVHDVYGSGKATRIRIFFDDGSVGDYPISEVTKVEDKITTE